MRRFVRFAVAALVLFGAALLAAGCGKKDWPHPQSESEEFKWNSVSGYVDDGCLVVAAGVGGAWRNLSLVALELSGETDCLGCPFNPDKRLEIRRDSKAFTAQGPQFRLRYCPDAPRDVFRWRVVGRNLLSSLGDVPSKVIVTRAPRPTEKNATEKNATEKSAVNKDGEAQAQQQDMLPQDMPPDARLEAAPAAP
ncbi:MAG: hypothetical protein H0S85_08900 [Desulfovibrionaceae bacterium]|nr:hypothetical protein [Desulfovibrionaceae bacterium]